MPLKITCTYSSLVRSINNVEDIIFVILTQVRLEFYGCHLFLNGLERAGGDGKVADND